MRRSTSHLLVGLLPLPVLLAQTLMTAALAALVALSLLLAIAFDYPFTGSVKIWPLPFDQALEQMPLDAPSH